MNELEKTIIASLLSIARMTIANGKAQSKLAIFVAERLPHISEDDKQFLINEAEKGERNLQPLEKTVEQLNKLVEM